jgi:sec-independent protein translocase protein TatA
MPNVGAFELIIILAVVLLLFGSTKLPKLAKSLGEAQKEFKKGVADVENPPPARVENPDDTVTMSKAEYEALRAQREALPRNDAPPSA